MKRGKEQGANNTAAKMVGVINEKGVINKWRNCLSNPIQKGKQKPANNTTEKMVGVINEKKAVNRKVVCAVYYES